MKKMKRININGTWLIHIKQSRRSDILIDTAKLINLNRVVDNFDISTNRNLREIKDQIFLLACDILKTIRELYDKNMEELNSRLSKKRSISKNQKIESELNYLEEILILEFGDKILPRRKNTTIIEVKQQYQIDLESIINGNLRLIHL